MTGDGDAASFVEQNTQNSDFDPLETFSSAVKQWTFFDFGFSNGTLTELTLRSIPEPDLHKVIAICASINFELTVNINNETKKAGSKHRLCQCQCKKHVFEARCCSDPTGNAKDRLCKVFTRNDANDECRGCSCCTHSKSMKGPRIKNCVISNHPSVRRLLSNKFLLDSARLAHLMKGLPIFKGKPLPSTSAFCSIARDLKAVCHFKMTQHCHLPPQCLSQFSSTNPGATVALQGDQHHQFHRLFVGFPVAKHHGILTLLILIVDCFHCQCPQCDGTAIVMATKAGSGPTVFLAFGIIPSEDTNSAGWFLQMCAKHGVDCAKSPSFTDQGPLLSAARILTETHDCTFAIMLCLQHLIRSVRHEFPDFFIKTNHAETCLRQANAVTSTEDFLHILAGVVHHFASLFPSLTERVVDMGLCVSQCHPSHWTTFANLPDFDDSEFKTKREDVIASWHAAAEAARMCDQQRKPCSLDDIRSLTRKSNRWGQQHARQSGFKKIVDNIKMASPFCVSTTNIAESGASLMCRCEGRCHIPPLSMLCFFKQHNAQTKTCVDDLRASEMSNLTIIGENIRSLNKPSSDDDGMDCKKTMHTISSTSNDENGDADEDSNNENSDNDEDSFSQIPRDMFDDTRGSNSTLATPSGANDSTTQETFLPVSGALADQQGFSVPNDHTPEPSADVASEHSMTVTGIFHGENETFKANLTWHPSLVARKDPFAFEHSCQHHKELTCMLRSPCTCIQKLAEHAIKENRLENMSFQMLFPIFFQSKRNHERLNTKEDGLPLAEALCPSTPDHDIVNSKQNSRFLDEKALQKMNPNVTVRPTNRRNNVILTMEVAVSLIKDGIEESAIKDLRKHWHRIWSRMQESREGKHPMAKWADPEVKMKKVREAINRVLKKPHEISFGNYDGPARHEELFASGSVDIGFFAIKTSEMVCRHACVCDGCDNAFFGMGNDSDCLGVMPGNIQLGNAKGAREEKKRLKLESTVRRAVNGEAALDVTLNAVCKVCKETPDKEEDGGKDSSSD